MKMRRAAMRCFSDAPMPNSAACFRALIVSPPTFARPMILAPDVCAASRNEEKSGVLSGCFTDPITLPPLASRDVPKAKLVVTKNQLSPPLFVTARPVEFASAYVSNTHCTVFGEQAGPVRSVVAALEGRKATRLPRSSSFRANATAGFGTSTMASMLSTSRQRLAIVEPTSALFWWSAVSSSTLMSGCFASKSSIASFAATTEPWPVASANRLDWSFRTPILTTPFDISAAAGLRHPKSNADRVTALDNFTCASSLAVCRRAVVVDRLSAAFAPRSLLGLRGDQCIVDGDPAGIVVRQDEAVQLLQERLLLAR